MATRRTPRSRRKAQPRAVIVHSLEDARAALRAARSLGVPVTLRSAPHAAGYAGPAWFRELAAIAATEFPDVRFIAVLDCGAAAGDALTAMRAGVRAIRFAGRKAVRDKIVAIARRCGTIVDDDDAKALDLQGVPDAEAACRSWLGGGAD